MSVRCPVCRTDGADGHSNHHDASDVTCPRCGPYTISGTAEAILNSKPLAAPEAANAAGWLRENPGSMISSNTVDWLRSIPAPTVAERADKLLLEISRRVAHIGDWLDLQLGEGGNKDADWLGVTWSQNYIEVSYLLCDYLRDNLGVLAGEGLSTIHAPGGMAQATITPQGHARIDAIRRRGGDGRIGFCAMWFSPSMNAVWADAIAPAISDAGYEPVRIDKHEHTNRIDDEILAMIRRSRFVVADFTDHRTGVYFEAGFALGVGLRVFWTCRSDELGKAHFDTRQYNTIDWDAGDLPDLRKRLAVRIEAVMGRGPILSSRAGS